MAPAEGLRAGEEGGVEKVSHWYRLSVRERERGRKAHRVFGFKLMGRCCFVGLCHTCHLSVFLVYIETMAEVPTTSPVNVMRCLRSASFLSTSK